MSGTPATLAAVLLLSMAFLAGYQYAAGQRDGLHLRREAAIAQLRERVAGLEDELRVSRLRAEMDGAAQEMLRVELAGYKEQIAALQEGLLFYKSLIAPSEQIAEGLSLREVELVALEPDRRFGFRIVAQQEARRHDLLKGQLRAQVYGLRDGEAVTYPLSALSEDLVDEWVSLRFRYYQSVEGVLSLPEGFEPQGIRITAVAHAPRRMEAVGDFPWRVKERFFHVGQ